ncbi:MAG: DNA alkylation repair protein, partial [Bacteroidales bacterium]
MENPSAFQIKKHLFSIANPEKANSLPYFFKTGVGQYGEGDQFIGVMIPQQRALVKQYGSLSLEEIQKLLKESYHECRMIGLLFLVSAFKNAKAEGGKNEIFEFYIQQFQYINNWDLVDLSCPNIVGAYLLDKDRSILQEFAYRDHLWTQRIAMVSCFAFIRENQFKDSFVI